jgi:hypothetical protein
MRPYASRLGQRHHSVWRNSAGRKMKAYLVLDLSINDLGGFGKYIAAIPAFIEKHGGKYIVQGVKPTYI